VHYTDRYTLLTQLSSGQLKASAHGGQAIDQMKQPQQSMPMLLSVKLHQMDKQTTDVLDKSDHSLHQTEQLLKIGEICKCRIMYETAGNLEATQNYAFYS